MADLRRKAYDPAELVRFYVEESLTTTELALKFRVWPMTICRHLERAGVDRRRSGPNENSKSSTKPPKLAQAANKDVFKHFKRNSDLFRNQQKAELKRRSELKILHREGVRRFQQEQAEEIRRLYELDRLTMDVIGERLGISPSCVAARLKLLDVHPRRRGPSAK